MERVKGFEPSTSTLARLRSTPELHPLLQTTFPICVSSLFCIGKNVRHIHARFGAAQTKNDSWTKASTCSTSVGFASRGRGEGLDVA